jgi:hypothetical protein
LGGQLPQEENATRGQKVKQKTNTSHIVGKSNGTPGNNGAFSAPQNNDRTFCCIAAIRHAQNSPVD